MVALYRHILGCRVTQVLLIFCRWSTFKLFVDALRSCAGALPQALNPLSLFLDLAAQSRWRHLFHVLLIVCPLDQEHVSRCGLAVRRLAGKQKDLGSIRFGSPFSSLQQIVVYGHCLVTLPTQLMEH